MRYKNVNDKELKNLLRNDVINNVSRSWVALVSFPKCY